VISVRPRHERNNTVSSPQRWTLGPTALQLRRSTTLLAYLQLKRMSDHW
jgi:hypothetical protein